MQTNEKNDQESFAVNLIESLKSKGYISAGIMLPYLIGAYRIKEHYAGPIHVKYLAHVYNDVIKSLYRSNHYLYFRECEASNNFILELCEIKLKIYNTTILHNGKAVIYCKDAAIKSFQNMTTNAASGYFLDKLIEITAKYCNFDDCQDQIPLMREFNDDEITFIRSILTK